MTKNKQKVNYFVCLLLAILVHPLQAAQSDNMTTDRHYEGKALVQLFEIRGIGLQIVKYIGCTGRESYTALHWSVRLGHLDCAKYLVRQSATNDENRKRALYWSAKDGQLDCVKYLLEEGVDINAKDKWGQTALHWSAQAGRLGIVKCLVEQGADTNVKDMWGGTALQWAKTYRYQEIVKCLEKNPSTCCIIL